MIYINIANFVLISQLEEDHGMTETHHLKKTVIFIQTILSFVLSRKIKNIYNDIVRNYGNVTANDFRKYEKVQYKSNKLKLDIKFLSNCKQIVSLNSRMFLIQMLYEFVKDSFVALSRVVVKNSNIFQRNSIYPKLSNLKIFLLLTSTSLQNL